MLNKGLSSKTNLSQDKKTLTSRMVKNGKKYYQLYIMLIPCAIFLLIFAYYPMYGVVLAFKDYKIKLGIMGSPWATPFFKYFQDIFSDKHFFKVTYNTIVISLGRLIAGFPAPIILTLLLNELRSPRYKKVVQTIMYMPYFLSWVIMAGVLKTLLMDEGIINTTLNNLGFDSIPFLTSNRYFVPTMIVSDIWKSVGFASIIYLAAVSGIDPELYEAAKIDGANRWHRMRYITIPSITMAISINLILSLSGILNAGFDQIFNLYSPQVYDTADIIDTYVYRIGLLDGKYALATALGLFKSVIGLLLIVITNKVVNKLGGEGVW